MELHYLGAVKIPGPIPGGPISHLLLAYVFSGGNRRKTEVPPLRFVFKKPNLVKTLRELAGKCENQKINYKMKKRN